MSPLAWRSTLRSQIIGFISGDRFFLRFARTNGALFVTDAARQCDKLEGHLLRCGYTVERSGSLLYINVPLAWYRTPDQASLPNYCAGDYELAALAHRLWRERGEITQDGHAFLCQVAHMLYGSPRIKQSDLTSVRKQAALLQRCKDTGSFAAATGLLAGYISANTRR